MRKTFTILSFIGGLFFITWGCSQKWTQTIQYGEVSYGEINESIKIEIQKGLIFIPITIRGKQYRFLFDSGAPFSISKHLQNEHHFNVVSKGKIVDSDRNKKKVNWAQVDSLSIGKTWLIDQTAFIGDFEANPILKC